jgi:hypothetical protein
MQPCAPAPVAPIAGQHVELADIVPVPRQTRARDRRGRWPQPPDIMSALTLPSPRVRPPIIPFILLYAVGL